MCCPLSACSINSTGGQYQLYKLRIIIITVDPKTPINVFFKHSFYNHILVLIPHQTRTGREVRAASFDSNAPRDFVSALYRLEAVT